MATFTAIPEKKQTATAMKRVLDYVMQDKKTTMEGVKLVSGVNCVAESAYEEFMTTKHRYGKAKGVFFKQYVQSFKPDCGVTPQQIHEIGRSTAEFFDGFEVVVATHIDRDHWHNHFVVNSVNCETGYKIQIGEAELENLRHKSDEICQRYGLEILTPYEKPKQKAISQREYRAAVKGSSRKIKLTNAIDYAVAHSRTKDEFMEQMKKLGYGVKWIDRYKYITYTTPEGQAFRDNKLLDNRYLKTNMEALYDEYGRLKENESHRGTDRGNSRSSDRTHTTYIPSADTEAVQPTGTAYQLSWEDHCKQYGFDIGNAEYDGRPGTQDKELRKRGESVDPFKSGVRIIQADGEAEGYIENGAEGMDISAESERPFSMETEAQMGGDWSDIALGGIRLVADISEIGQTDETESKPKSVRERKHRRKKHQSNDDHNDDGGMQMGM